MDGMIVVVQYCSMLCTSHLNGCDDSLDVMLYYISDIGVGSDYTFHQNTTIADGYPPSPRHK
jgi:hypothetical protein